MVITGRLLTAEEMTTMPREELRAWTKAHTCLRCGYIDPEHVLSTIFPDDHRLCDSCAHDDYVEEHG